MTKNEKTEERSRLVFVYGTLQTGGPLNDAMIRGDAQYFGDGRIMSKDFVMRNLTKYPALQRVEAGSGTHISGEVWIIPTKSVKSIDKVEGCPGFFQRTDVTVWLDNEQGVSHTAFTYHLPFEGANKKWMSHCEIIKSGKWDVSGECPDMGETSIDGCGDMEDCPECGYWMVDNTCSNCQNYYGRTSTQEYYDDNVVTDAWDDTHHDGPDDAESAEASTKSLAAAGFSVDGGIFITSDFGEMHGPYDSIQIALERLAGVAEESGVSCKCFTIGFRVYESCLSVDDYNRIEESTILV